METVMAPERMISIQPVDWQAGRGFDGKHASTVAPVAHLGCSSCESVG
jgi:hypothetical protein